MHMGIIKSYRQTRGHNQGILASLLTPHATLSSHMPAPLVVLTSPIHLVYSIKKSTRLSPLAFSSLYARESGTRR